MIPTVAWVQEADPGTTPPSGQGAQESQLWNMAIWFVAIFAIFYFLLIRPQKKQERAKRAMLEALAKNDRVLTQGGIFGTVANLTDDEVTLKVDDSNNTRIRVARHAVVAVVTAKSEAAES